MTSQDERYMRRAIALAQVARVAGDVPVGAVLIDGDTQFETCNEKELRADPTAHAEMLAIRQAAHHRGSWRLAEATLYVTKEPCVMCAGAMVAARIKRLVYALNDPKGGADGGAFDVLRSANVNHRIEIDAGILQEEASAQLLGFFRDKRAESQREGIQKATP